MYSHGNFKTSLTQKNSSYFIRTQLTSKHVLVKHIIRIFGIEIFRKLRIIETGVNFPSCLYKKVHKRGLQDRGKRITLRTTV